MDSNKPNSVKTLISPLHKWLAEGDAFAKLHQYKEALQCYVKAAQEEPSNRDAWHNQAEAQVMCLQYKESLESCDQALRIDAAHADTWFLKSFALGVLGEYEQALVACTKGLELDPTNKMVWCTKGQYLYALGRLEEALECFSTALKLDPDSEYFKQLSEKIQRWMKRDGQSDAVVNKVMGLLQQGGSKEAMDAYKASLQVDPRSVSKSFEKNFALAHLENPEQMLRQLEKAKTEDQPQITLELSQKEFEFGRESWVEVILSNKGKTVARDLSFVFPPEASLKHLDVTPELIQKIREGKAVDIDQIPELQPGNHARKLVSLTPARLGQIPLDVEIHYVDSWATRQTKTTVTWISTFKPSEQLPTVPGYKLQWRLNTGDAVNIYVAQKATDPARLVVKIPRFTQEQISMTTGFLNEVKQWQKLIHPNIVKVYQYGENPTPWIAMEYMPRGPLTRRIGHLGVTEALQIAIQLTDAMAYARTARITHRNVTPDNVLFDGKDVPKLTNWRIGPIMQKLRKISGPDAISAYTPPETFGMGGVDWVSDIYQLGVLLYEMLTGKPPFHTKGVMLRTQIEQELPASPSQVNPSVTVELSMIVMKCLAKSKNTRYQDFAEIKTDLSGALISHLKMAAEAIS